VYGTVLFTFYEKPLEEQLRMKKMPDYLYHYSPRENRASILHNGLLGAHNGEWCIYLAEDRHSWEAANSDCWRVSTKNLNCMDFTSADENLDEVLYWGRIQGKIAISKNDIELLEVEK
jgi:hypothetical protein